MSSNSYYQGQPPSYNNQQSGYTGSYGQDQTTYPDHTQTSGTSQWQDTSNPYGYPSSNAAQPYYGHNEYNQSQGYSQQYPIQNQSQQYDNYNGQYNAPPQQGYQQHGMAYSGTDQYGSGYSNQAQYSSYQQGTSHDPYAYDATRQQGYDYNKHAGIPPDPAITAAKINPNNPSMVEGERGLMGALAGGAAGAYGGHKMGHGFLGAIGGAVAGSMLEDHVKKDKKDKKDKNERTEERKQRRSERRSRRGSSSSSSSSSSSDSDDHKKKRKHRKHRSEGGSSRGVGSGYDGNFSASSSNITLDRDYDLIALCADVEGKEKLSSLDLKDCLTNDHGTFRWSRRGGAFSRAKNVRLIDSGRALEAELDDGRGGFNLSRIALDERISNENGELVFLK